jgi:hypothetical protein
MKNLAVVELKDGLVKVQLPSGAMVYIDCSMYKEDSTERISVYPHDDLRYTDSEINVTFKGGRIDLDTVDYPNKYHSENK